MCGPRRGQAPYGWDFEADYFDEHPVVSRIDAFGFSPEAWQWSFDLCECDAYEAHECECDPEDVYDNLQRFYPDSVGLQPGEDPPDHEPLITGLADLEDYGSGHVPDHETDSRRARLAVDHADYLYSIRDRLEYADERRARASGDLTHVRGSLYPASYTGSKEWLDDQLSALRLRYAIVRKQAVRFWDGRLPRSWASVKDDPQLLWMVRRSELLRIQFNVRRKCEALDVNPDPSGARLYQAPARDADADALIAAVDAKATGKVTAEQRDRYLEAYEHALWAYGQAHKRPMPQLEVEDLEHELAQALLHEMEFMGQTIPDREPVRVLGLIPVEQPRVPGPLRPMRDTFAQPTSYNGSKRPAKPYKYTESLVAWISEQRAAA
jgi:hypothetical protein